MFWVIFGIVLISVIAILTTLMLWCCCKLASEADELARKVLNTNNKEEEK